MSGLQSGSQDATGRLLQAISSIGCRYTCLYCTASDYGPVAFRLIASKAGALASGSLQKKALAFLGLTGLLYRLEEAFDRLICKGGDSRKPFIQSEVAGG